MPLVWVAWAWGKTSNTELHFNSQLIDTTSTSQQEIERRWLVHPSKLPFNLDTADKPIVIEQSMGTTPVGHNFRIRKETHPDGRVVWTYTTKTKQSYPSLGKTKTETTSILTPEAAMQLWNPSVTLHKLRYYIDGFEIDVFITPANPDQLVLVEREFASHHEADNFILPAWLTQEITHIKGYSNQSLAKYGWPHS